MKNLLQVKLTSINPKFMYILTTQVYECYSDGGMRIQKGTGADVIQALKDNFSYDDWEEERKDDNKRISDNLFLKELESRNVTVMIM